jgi:MoaA/NifB/PqqE/SkfB family radical SAM enzyme
MEISLVLSSRCNASCSHCSTNCGPHRTEALGQDEIIRLMNETAAIDDGRPLEFHITGGEPFLDFDLLVAIVAHGTGLGGLVTCLTNAFWARSTESAREKLTQLRDAGLDLLGISVSRFHERYVPLSRVRLALEVAASVGVRTQLQGSVTASDFEPGAALSRWKHSLRADHVAIFPVIPCLREGAHLPDDEYCRQEGLPTHACPDEQVCIEADGTAFSCCGQKRSTGFLAIGNIREQSLATVHQRFKRAGRQRILRDHGPIAFARGAIAAGLGHLLRESYAGPCDLCVHIASDPQLRAIAEHMSAAAEFDSTTVTEARP